MAPRGLGLRMLCAAVLCTWPAASGYVPPTKYLIVSDAVNGNIAYAKLTSPGVAGQMTPLITTGLVHPQGIAVDQKRQLLLVADSDPKKVFSYGLSVAGDGTLKVDQQTPLVENVEARWVAVDGVGNVFASDETQNQLVKVSAKQVQNGDTKPSVIYSGSEEEKVSAPGGIAADNFFVYWTNKLNTGQAGALARGLASPKNESSGVANSGGQSSALQVLSSKSPKAYGVCVATDNIFYTDNADNVYAVKKSGGGVATVTGNLTSPRGCAWDGDSTVYVADRSQGAVYSFDGPVMNLAQMQATVTKVVDYSDAFGVAVFSSAPGRGPLLALGALLLASAAGLASA